LEHRRTLTRPRGSVYAEAFFLLGHPSLGPWRRRTQAQSQAGSITLADIHSAYDTSTSLALSSITEYFFIFFLSRICKNIWSVRNFAKLYICRRGPRRQGHNTVAHGVRDITPWPTAVGAASSGPLVWDKHSAVAHDVRSIGSWAMAL
jgi:hypothetical protein